MAHNSWVVKKPSAASKPWDKCTVNDVRLVVGLDPLNKFLADPPGKITKIDSIYSSLASWEFMGELDFSDFYFQIKFRTVLSRGCIICFLFFFHVSDFILFPCELSERLSFLAQEDILFGLDSVVF